MTLTSAGISQWVRTIASRLWSREFLTFLLFLLLSAVLWLITTLNETYKRDLTLPLKLVNVPKNVVVTTDLPQKLTISVTDKGFGLLAFRAGRHAGLTVDFPTYAGSDGYGTMSAAELTKQISAQLPPSATLGSVRPQQLDFWFNYGESKRLPVEVVGEFTPASHYYLSAVGVEPDSVTVYARREMLDTLSAARTVRLYERDFADTLTIKARLQSAQGVKFTPADVRVRLRADRLVEKSVQVPVRQLNFPPGKVLRTFPASVTVTFQVGMSQYRTITADDFTLNVSYEDLLGLPSAAVPLRLSSVPQGVRHARISPATVEYVIEEMPNADAD